MPFRTDDPNKIRLWLESPVRVEDRLYLGLASISMISFHREFLRSPPARLVLHSSTNLPYPQSVEPERLHRDAPILFTETLGGSLRLRSGSGAGKQPPAFV